MHWWQKRGENENSSMRAIDITAKNYEHTCGRTSRLSFCQRICLRFTM